MRRRKARRVIVENLESRQLLAGGQLAATVVSVAPAQLRLDWDYVEHWTNTIERRIYRRPKGDAASWGSPIVTLTSAKNTLNWTDTTLTGGLPYEYRIETYVNNSSTISDLGHVSGGVNLPLVESRGKVLLLVDQSQALALAPELAQLQADLAGDGWTVLRSDLPRATVEASVLYTPAVGAARLAEVSAIKSVIVNAYNADPANFKSVFIIGHIPVPYSGNIAPDGHVPDHQGAWPADTYYADVNGTWTDTSVNTSGATDPRNRNAIGDGKFDQSYIPTDLELHVGRIDFTNMTQSPGAPFGETELLRNYLRRDHEYRFRLNAYTNIDRRAVVINAFAPGTGSPSMLPSINATLGGDATIVDYPSYPGNNAPWFKWMEENPTRTYLIGSAQTAGGSTGNGAGSTRDFGLRPSRSVFNVMFGSYLGDIEFSNNFMRGSIAGNAAGDSLGLTCWWAGRPNLYLQSMGLGETIGYSSRVSQNNSGTLYDAGYSARGTHTLLLGDPTLRMYMVQPPQNLQATSSSGSVGLSWGPSTESGLVGYVVYRGTSASGPFTRLTASPISSASFNDAGAVVGTNYTYLVKTVKLEITPAGAFENSSQAAIARISPISSATPIPLAPTSLEVTAPNSNTILLSWLDHADNETGYRIERRSGSGEAFSSLVNLPAGSTSYTDTGPLVAGTIFYYRVFAVGASGDSAPNTEVYANGYAGSIGFARDVSSFTRTAGVDYVDVLVERIGGSVGTASVGYTTTNNTSDTARPGVDYVATSGTLSFADGETQKMIRLSLLTARPHLPVSFTMTLSSPSPNSGLTQRSSTRVLVADDTSPLQSPWQQTMLGYNIDPGAVGQVGGDLAASYWGGSWGGSSETGRYIYQAITGDSVLTVKITAPDVETAALMVRANTTNPYGKMVAIRLTSGNTGAQQVTRKTDVSWPNTVITEPSTSNNIKAPYWARMTRSGDQFTSEISPDGITWSFLATQDVPGMPSAALWGFFVEVSQYVNLQRAVFSNISITSVPVPADPTNLVGARVATGGQLTWTDASSNESGFRIERRVAGTGSFIEIATVGAGVPTYTDTTAAAASSYEYRVCAYNNSGNSAYSDVALVGPLAVPEAPTALTVTGDNAGDFTLNWTDNSLLETGFAIERRAEGGTFAQVATVASTRYIDTTPLYDTGYEYRVRAYNAAGNSAYTNIAVVANLAGQDMSVTTGTGQGADAQISKASPDVNYGSATTFTLTNNSGATVVSDAYLRFDLAGAPAGSAWFANSASVSIIFTSTPNPTTYCNTRLYLLGESADSWDESTITWNNAPYNSAAPALPAGSLQVGYWYIYNSGGVAAGATFPWLDGGLISQLSSRVAAGKGIVTLYATTYSGYTGAFAADEHATYAPPTLTVAFRKQTPRRATNLTGAALDPNTLSLQWADNASNETGYRVEVSTDGGATYSTLTTLAANTTSLTTSSIPSGGGSQVYRVVALNSYGDATASLPTTVLVPTPPTVSSFMINDGAAQRSMVRNLTVVFNEAVTVADGAITVKSRSGADVLNTLVTTTNPNGDGRTYVLSFSNTAVINGSLADGMYQLVVTAGGVRDLAGDAMTANYTSRFHRLFGDADGDRDVDTLDLAQFRKALNRSAMYDAYSFFDFDGDRNINSYDYLQLKSRLARRVLK